MTALAVSLIHKPLAHTKELIMKIPFKYFEAIEKRTWLLGILTAAFLSLGGLAEITPLFAAANSVKAPEGVKPYSAERLAGFEVYVHNRSEERRVGKECRYRWWRSQ